MWWVRLLPVSLAHPMLEHCFRSWLLCFQASSLPVYMEKQQRVVQILGPLNLNGRPDGVPDFWLLPRPASHWCLLGSEPVDRMLLHLLLSLSLCLWNIFFFQEKSDGADVTIPQYVEPLLILLTSSSMPVWILSVSLLTQLPAKSLGRQLLGKQHKMYCVHICLSPFPSSAPILETIIELLGAACSSLGCFGHLVNDPVDGTFGEWPSRWKSSFSNGLPFKQMNARISISVGKVKTSLVWKVT